MVTESTIFRDFLKMKNLRWTPQREKILEMFLMMSGHISAEQLHRKSREANPSIGIATTYRTLSLLVQSGLIRENDGGKGKNYELEYQRGHHDHLICTHCDKVVEFEHPMIEKLQIEVSERSRFTLKSHKMVLRGFCGDCRLKHDS